MKAIRAKNTKPELLLGKAMWALGLRYRKHFALIGKPDFVLTKYKIAIFCDGDFWHGNNWKVRGLGSLSEELKSYSPYWQNKITNNIQRDILVNQSLAKQGWVVLRFWENDIIANPKKCSLEIWEEYIKRKISFSRAISSQQENP